MIKSIFRKRRFKKNTIILIMTALVIFVAMTVNFSTDKVIPTWHNIFASLGLSDISSCSYSDDMQVHFLDVGKADAIFIKCKDKNVLIDAADVDNTDKVVEYLNRHDVKKLDLVVVTHPHRDHIGQMSKVVRKFNIDKFIMPRVPDAIKPTSRTYEKLLLSLKDRNIKASVPNQGEQIELGDMKINILSVSKEYDNINNYSVVLQICYGEEKFLFMGDAEKEAERDIMRQGYNLGSTVLKVGHHGSLTSSTKEFLDKVSPQYAVICVGHDRSNLPKDATLKKLNKVCSNVLRTDKDGTIILSTSGKGIHVYTEKRGALN